MKVKGRNSKKSEKEKKEKIIEDEIESEEDEILEKEEDEILDNEEESEEEDEIVKNETVEIDEEIEEELKEINEAKKNNSDNSLLTKTEFASRNDVLCEKSLKGLNDMQMKFMTKIQEQSLDPLIGGKDLLASAKTGSGKTLAFLLPAIEIIHRLKFMPRNGTGVLIISPTRELCIQIFGVLKDILKYHHHTFGLCMGGCNRSDECKKLEKGINILVCTPGRILDHLRSTDNFLVKNLQVLIIDEADRLLDIGFEEDMKQIISLLPKTRQTMLFSATQTRRIEDLAKMSLKKEPLYMGVNDEADEATVEGLEQGYVIAPSEKRFLLLYTFLRRNRKKKLMVFMSSCLAVKYFHELLNYIDLPVLCIHGRQKQAKRTQTFLQFSKIEQGILLCTDVAARGLDIPQVDWIVQYDPPDDPKEYIHRVGRTARAGASGNALMILRPEEMGFLKYLKKSKVKLQEFDFSWNKIPNVQEQLEKLIKSNYYLHMSARDAFKSYLRSYNSHSMKTVFKIASLDLKKVASSFGFTEPPPVDLGSISIRNRTDERQTRYGFKSIGKNNKKPNKKNFSSN
ncbi:hypothetical protein SNEBB_009284 [Seison nebaliae]|nr:hypothetical protein SNEBB_009284 [Seison nebaliae]